MVHATKPLFLTFTIIIFIFSSGKVISTQKMTAFHGHVPMTQMGYLSFGSFDIPQLRYEGGRGWHRPPLPPACLDSKSVWVETPNLIKPSFSNCLKPYHLELQANPKKIVQKTDAIFSI